MKINSVKFQVLSLSETPQSHQMLNWYIDLTSSKTFEQSLRVEAPTVFVVISQDLSSVKRFPNLIIDRGQKHHAKPLAKLLLGYSKIPILRGSYSICGQLIRSMMALGRHALKANENGAFVIGVSRQLFGELLQKTAAEESNAIRMREHPDEVNNERLLEWLKRYQPPKELGDRYFGTSVEMQLVRHRIVMASKQEMRVLILGESGTGKEVVARAIHDLSARKREKFAAVNCGAIAPTLFESELFGHVRGAFTGADHDKMGLWEVAEKGTLFLDEIGDLPKEHQVKILRALEEKTIRRVGDTRDIRVNARIIAATNRDLHALMQTGRFRSDLYYRLGYVQINTPPLRDHPEDIPLLANKLWQRITRTKRGSLSREILAELQKYRWPGNVRELRMVLMNLQAYYFPDSDVTFEQFQAVFQMQFQQTVAPDDPLTQDELRMHRVHCLRHLKRVDELVRASKVTVRPIVWGGRTDAKTARSVRVPLENQVAELDYLCLKPNLVRSMDTLNAVRRFNGQLREFGKLLRKGIPAAMEFWHHQDMSQHYRETQEVILLEIEHLTERT